MNEEGERQLGRRDRKKAATRRALLQTAARMFAEHGYQDTTVKGIAAAAGVTERTFFRYFPSKEDLIFTEILDLVPLLRREIPRRPADEPPLTAVLNALLSAAGKLDGGLAILFVGAPPRALSTGTGRTRVLWDFEGAIAEALAERQPDEDPLRAQVLARVSVAVIRSALIAYADQDAGIPPRRSVEDFVVLLREAFETVRDAV
ncbi:TetR family transcriptional regulator [Streptomyces olivaceoviridis]|uniref:TetR family transcriptional regulator n=1 Tax=Streptomyces olivaceoviridis TaxID=1921 RepID=UPI0036AD66EC